MTRLLETAEFKTGTKAAARQASDVLRSGRAVPEAVRSHALRDALLRVMQAAAEGKDVIVLLGDDAVSPTEAGRLLGVAAVRRAAHRERETRGDA